jgi:lipopolysaccharide transport system ATP-binding protein
MSGTVIKVENLGKKYMIRHQQSERYTALRDVLTNKFKSFGKRLISLQPHSCNLQPSREEFWALKDVSFEVKEGDRVGIIGRNGAGKTTLLKLLSRITEPTTGRIRIKGRVASLLEVGTGFHPELTGRENIFLNGAILGMTKSEIKRKFDEIVDFAEIEKFLDTPVKRYSSGMYVRLAFAVAGHLEPEILLVDEVLAVGDAQFQKKCLGKMEEVGNEGRTVLFVSHNMGMISSLCRNGVLLTMGSGQYFSDVSSCILEYMSQLASDSETEILLNDKKRPQEIHLRGAAKFVAARMVNGFQDLRWQIPFPMAPALKFAIEICAPVPNLSLGIALYNHSHVEIASAVSTDVIKIISIKPGTYEITAEYQDLVLLPGHYVLGVALSSDIGLEDYIPDSLHFQITESKEAGDIRAHNRNGVLIPKLSYDIEGKNPVEIEKLIGPRP